uniref:thioredoxin-like n=1 Tax=Styela clava TaxID=7725 RepID=UPI001939D750|nr:thioredoxin-like [Styela clava]
MSVIQCHTKEDFDKQLCDAGQKLVVVDFYATWCGPCKVIGPKVAAMSGEYKNAVFLKVDVDENSDTTEKHGISAMPTFLFFKDGQKVDELVGASEAKLREMIEKNI